jgi:flagellum-specific peptidoglycan hydrolase FlgJ
MIKRLLVSIVIIGFSLTCYADSVSKEKRNQFIKKFAPFAIEATKGTTIPPSVVIAQGIEESGWGTSKNCREYNNYFGLKNRTKKGDFAQFRNPREAFAEYVKFLKHPRYSYTLSRPTVETFIWALFAAGYCETPNYDMRLLTLIDKYQLKKFDGQRKSTFRYFPPFNYLTR